MLSRERLNPGGPGFVNRKIRLTFQLGEGAFGLDGFNTVQLPDDLRVSASIRHSGGVSMQHCQLRVFGLSMDLMNRLTTLQKALTTARRNVVTVEAGDDVSGMAVVFIGVIQEAWADMNSSPEVSLFVDAHTGLLDALRPVPPKSYNGYVDVAVILASIAAEMGVAFENSGVSVQLAYPYLPGTLRQQALACAQAAGINMILDNSTLAIWPKGGVRHGAAVLLNKDTGMVGYPSFTGQGIVVTSIFNPNIAFGGTVQVESALTPACGQWTPFNVSHDLESQVPGGKWFTTLEATVLGHVALPGHQ